MGSVTWCRLCRLVHGQDTHLHAGGQDVCTITFIDNVLRRTLLSHESANTSNAAESKRIEQAAEDLAKKQKWIVGQITEKNGTPDGCSEQMVKAFLSLKS